MSDNKVRLSRDVLEKAEHIAAEWGLKNARAAVEAVFRCYCEVYHHDQLCGAVHGAPASVGPWSQHLGPSKVVAPVRVTHCEALDALDELLAL